MGLVPGSRPRQLKLPFDDTPLWDTRALEAALGRECARSLSLTLTENRSVLLSFRRAGGGIQLRLHRMFLHAPPLVVRALARSLRRTSRSADGEVRRFMNHNLHRGRRTPRPPPPLQNRGRAHDLNGIYPPLDDPSFPGQPQAPPTPGPRRRAAPPR